MSGFGPEGLDRNELPEGWPPWTADFDNGGSPVAAPYRGYEGWPVSADGGTASPVAGLVLGGALFLVFENGTVISAYAP